jgi:putative endonuclease
MNIIKSWFVYILECSDGTLYTGSTNNIERRIQQHNKGTGAKYTKGRAPVVLLRWFKLENKSQALKLEYKIKQLTKKEKLSFSLEKDSLI